MFRVTHVLGLGINCYGIYYDHMYVHIPRHGKISDFGGRTKYLTYWNLILQAVYFGICIINDVFGSNEINPKNKPTVRKVKDYLLASLALPLSLFVGLTFWGLMAIDRELVFPKVLDLYFPSWLNHVMHTNIVIFSILEVVTTFRLYPSRSSGMKGLVSLMAVYLAWTHYIFYHTGEWVYPVCDVLNWWQRVCFFGSMIAFAVFLYIAGEKFNNKVWEKEVKYCETQKKHGHRKNN